MIKRSLQEVADFFGCMVVRDITNNGATLEKKDNNGVLDTIGYLFEDVLLPTNTKESDFAFVYKPNLSEKPTDSVGSAKNETTTKAPHQSEVHTHREYCVIKNETPAGLSKQTTKLMDKGYKPLGGIAIGYEYGVSPRQYFYQAMVRGV